MADANFRDLSMGVAQLIEKRQLLKGEPTQIVSVDERKTLNQLLPLLIQEAARRGVIVSPPPMPTQDAIEAAVVEVVADATP